MGGRKGWEAKISLYHRSNKSCSVLLLLDPPGVVDLQIISRAEEKLKLSHVK